MGLKEHDLDKNKLIEDHFPIGKEISYLGIKMVISKNSIYFGGVCAEYLNAFGEIKEKVFSVG